MQVYIHEKLCDVAMDTSVRRRLLLGAFLFFRSLFSSDELQVQVILPPTMRTVAVATLSIALLASSVEAFQSPATARSVDTALFGYVPDGFTAESYKKFKQQEKEKAKKKNLGGLGPRGFKSRSMQSFQEAMERGEASHLLPVMNAKERVAKGELKPEDIPVSHYTGGRSTTRAPLSLM